MFLLYEETVLSINCRHMILCMIHVYMTHRSSLCNLHFKITNFPEYKGPELECLQGDDSSEILTAAGSSGKCGCGKAKPKWKDGACVKSDDPSTGGGKDKSTNTITPKGNGSDPSGKGLFSLNLTLLVTIIGFLLLCSS